MHLLFLLLGLLTSCSYLSSPIGNLFTSYSEDINPYHCYVMSQGEGTNIDKIRVIDMTIWNPQELDITEARKWYVYLVEGLVNKTNQDKIVMKELFPNNKCTSKNISIIFLYPKSKDDGNSTQKDIGGIFCVRGNVYYQLFRSDIDKAEIIFIEPYEEALRIVYGNGQ